MRRQDVPGWVAARQAGACRDDAAAWVRRLATKQGMEERRAGPAGCLWWRGGSGGLGGRPTARPHCVQAGWLPRPGPGWALPPRPRANSVRPLPSPLLASPALAAPTCRPRVPCPRAVPHAGPLRGHGVAPPRALAGVCGRPGGAHGLHCGAGEGRRQRVAISGSTICCMHGAIGLIQCIESDVRAAQVGGVRREV